jgi:ABC-type multidrug transport system fused ATPase/permease subunit
MDRGRIIESGSHFGLLEQSGLYAESWSRQMKSIPSADYAESV